MPLQALQSFPATSTSRIIGVLTDVDDTLTDAGRLRSQTLAAIEQLKASGRKVVAVTGGPAGWCDHFARCWPIDGVIGESGAFYKVRDGATGRLRTVYFDHAENRAEQAEKLQHMRALLIQRFADLRFASNQNHRECELAIDLHEDGPEMSPVTKADVIACLTEHGFRIGVSSIHINAWLGAYNKLEMTKRFFEQEYSESLEQVQRYWVFTGDSSNDGPMFAYFKHSVGVANVLAIQDVLSANNQLPAYVTQKKCSAGFRELVDHLLGAGE
jgi:HAD superfamily hydrolase (TIGR01484 family)